MSDYFKSEEDLRDALEYKISHPKVSFRYLEEQFGPKKDRICRRFNGTQKSRSERDAVNQRLNPAQEKALC